MAFEEAETGSRTSLRLRLLVPISIAITATVLYAGILLAAKDLHGAHRVLGWDTLTYAYSAQESAMDGLAFLFPYWGHPNLYVLLLTGVSILVGNTLWTANLLPIALVVGLGLSVGLLVRQMSAHNATALLAGILTVTSVATLRLFVDLHRALLALVGVAFLLALHFPQHLQRTRLNRWGFLALALLFLVAFAEFEIYLAFLPAILLYLILRRPAWRPSVAILFCSALPGLLFLLTPSGGEIVTRLIDVGTPGIPKLLTAELALFYLSTIVMVPFILLSGIRLVRRVWSSKGGTETLFLSWVLSLGLTLLLVGLVLQKFSPFRALLLLFAPALAALGVEEAVRGIRWIYKSSSKRFRILRPLRRLPAESGQVVFALIATGLVVISGIVVVQESDEMLSPVVSEDLYQKLRESTTFIAERGWPAPIYLVRNETYLERYTPIRLELSLLQGPTYLYFGPLNLVPWAVPPPLVDPILVQDRLSDLVLAEEYDRLTTFLDVDNQALLQHPLVVLTPDLFDRTVPDPFAPFEVEPGLFVIPPEALDLAAFLTWELRGAEDAYSLNGASLVASPWSRHGQVVETTARGYEIAFPYYFPITGAYSIAVHLFDFPALDPESQLPLSPVELWVGEHLVNRLTYSVDQVRWWNSSYVQPEGFEVITLRAAILDAPFRLSLDTIQISAPTP